MPLGRPHMFADDGKSYCVIVDSNNLDMVQDIKIGLLLGRLIFLIKIAIFWATVCKTICPMLSNYSLSCLSVCLSVTLVYCGQTVGQIKMPLGLGPGHIVLYGDPAPTQRGIPNFWPMSVVTKWLDGSKCHLVRRYALAQATCVRW